MNSRSVPDLGVYYRLIALWVLCEAMVGGMIHALRVPISGLVVGSAAVTCICLIAWYVPHKGAILKATIIVAVFKMVLSPHSSFPAYIAVFFQGMLGELLFRNRKYYRLSCLALAILSLLESGLQRILVLTIVYGNNLWVVVNDFINGLTRQSRKTNYSFWIGSIYLSIHLLAGIVVGLFAASLPQKIERSPWPGSQDLMGGSSRAGKPHVSMSKRKTRILFFIWFFLLAVYVQSEFSAGKPLFSPTLPLKILLRSLIVIGAWILVVSPLLTKLLKTWLARKQSGLKKEITAVTTILPHTERMIRKSWMYSSKKKGLRRIRVFSGILLTTIVKNIQQVYIFTGPVGSGKTTALESWARRRSDVGGILTPLKNGKRIFVDIRSGDEFPMEAGGNANEVMLVGRYRFDAVNFKKAIHILHEELEMPGWVIIDEIGPLELRNEGFAEVLTTILQNPQKNILIVVRDGLVDEVIQKFGIIQYDVTNVLPE